MFEVGKRYFRKNGTITEPLKAISPNQGPFCFEDKIFSYTAEGHLFPKDAEKLITTHLLLDYEGFHLDKEFVE